MTIENIIHNVHTFWINPDKRELWIHGAETLIQDDYDGDEPGVDYMMSTKVIKNLHLFLHQSKTKPVIIHLHSCGGIFDEGIAIYDTIRLMPYPVTIISYTHAESASSIIFQAGDRRLMLPNSSFMFHWGSLQLDGDPKAVRSTAKFSEIQDDMMFNLYAEKIKATNPKKFKDWEIKKIKSYLRSIANKKSDVYLTAQEAIEWGFADGIVERFPV